MRKNIFLRALYDFGNSIVMIIFLFYFSQWLVVEQWVAEIRYNMALVAASVLFILLAPYFGKLVDHGASKIKWLRIWTVIAAALFFIVGAMALRAPQHALIITALYSIALTAYLLCFVYYTPMLSDLAVKEDNAKISWRWQGVNSFGQVVGLLVSIPLLKGALPFLGEGRASTLIPAAVLFLLLSLPMLIRYNAPSRALPEKVAEKGMRTSIKELFSHKAVALFLIGYFLYSDALLTFSNNFPLYLEKVHMVDDTTKSILTACILLCASLSAFFTGKLADRKGLKKSMLFILGVMCILFPIFAFIKWFALLAIMSCITGVFYGPIRSMSRALLSKILPHNLAARGFSFYTIAERFATLIWPLARGSIVTWLGSGRVGYSRALISMSFLVLIGRWITKKIEH